MSRRLVTVVVVAITAAALAAVSPVATAAPSPQDLTLRLPDVGPSYELGSNRCGQRSSYEEGEWPSVLPGLAARYPHRGCVIAFGESWRVPGPTPLPSYIMSAAYVFADAAGPEAALRRPRSVAARILHAERRDLALLDDPAAIGDETRLLRLDGYPAPGIVALSRSGPVLALVLGVDLRHPVDISVALRLATAQQARIATPTPLLPSDLDDVEVPLNNPRLGVPVSWLGRELPADGKLPALRLFSVDGPSGSHPRSEPRVALSYDVRGESGSVILSLWPPRRVRRALRAPQLRRFCMRTYDARVDGVDATIVAYADPVPRHCAGSRPNTWVAAAFFPSVAITIEASTCYDCRRRAAYGSPAGLRAIVRALRPRPAPAEPSASSPFSG